MVSRERNPNPNPNPNPSPSPSPSRSRDQKEEMDRRRRPWSDLPVHILHLFLDRLYFEDRDRFAAVCKPWCSAVAGHRSLPVPLLLLSDDDDPKYVLLLSPAENGKIRRLKIPAGLVGRYWYGSSHGWLFIKNDILLNPFTKEQIKLPRSRSSGTEQILVNACMSSIAATFGGGVFAALRFSSEFAFCRLGDKTWSNHFHHLRFSDFLFFQGLLYGIDSMARLSVLEFGANPMIKERYHPTVRGTSCRPPLKMICLVPRGEELLMVVQSGQRSPAIRTTVGFDVFRLNPSRTEWVPVKNLDGWILFLGCVGGSFALEASKYPAFKPNCIFFSDYTGFYLFFMEDGSFRPYQLFGSTQSIFSTCRWLLYNAA